MTTFDIHADYARLLEGPHGRKSNPLSAPALTRHIGFWRPPSAALSRTARSETQLRRNNIDNYVSKLFLFLRDCETQPGVISNVSNNYTEILDGYRVESMLGRTENVDSRLFSPIESKRPDSYKPLIIYFRWHGLKAVIKFQLHAESVEVSLSVELKPALEMAASNSRPVSAIRSALDVVGNSQVPKSIMQLSHQTLYVSTWNQFDEEVFAPLQSFRSLLGEKVVDFRGFVQSASQIEYNNKSIFSLSYVFRRLGIIGSNSGEWNQEPNACGLREFRQLLPVLTSPLDDNSELTVSWFMNGRSIYASALGARSVLDTDRKMSPLCYLLYEDVATRRELGELVDLIHYAGAARIAAVMYFRELRQAGDGLRRVEKSIKDALIKISKDEQDNDIDPKGVLKNAIKLCGDIDTELAQATMNMPNEALQYRVQRSTYYIDQFKQTIDALAIDRIDGFQSYKTFVLRRTGAIFSYVSRLNDQLGRVQLERASLQNKVEGLESLVEEATISEVQKVGDIALFGALLPYYASHVVSTILHEYVSEKIIYLFFFVAGSAVAMYKWLSAWYPAFRKPFEIRRRAVALIAIATFIWGVALWAVGSHVIVEAEKPAGEAVGEAALQRVQLPHQQEPQKAKLIKSEVHETKKAPFVKNGWIKPQGARN